MLNGSFDFVCVPAASAADVVLGEVAAARSFQMAEKSAATRRAYGSDWRVFSAWCQARGTAPLPVAADVLAVFLASQASGGIAPSTLNRRLAAVRYAHALKGVDAPVGSEAVRSVLRGIRRTLGVAPEQKAPATADRVLAMTALLPAGLTGIRDRAMILLGFAGAFRRSELVGLLVSDLAETEEGLRITIRQSKGDQEGVGQVVAIPHGRRLGVVAAVRAWLAAAGITEGPVFRSVDKAGRVRRRALSPAVVALVVKAAAARAGFDPAEFAGHSLRAGFLTSAAEGGASVFKMMEVSRHKSADVLTGYIRRADLFKDHAGGNFL